MILNRRAFALVLVSLLVAAVATADEIRVVTSGAFTAAYLELVPQFERATGHKVVTAFGASIGPAPSAIPNRLQRGEARPLSPRQREIAEALGPTLAKRGLLLVGLDIIGEHLTEVNVTSPTCFREITDQTGFDVPGMFMDALEKQIEATVA